MRTWQSSIRTTAPIDKPLAEIVEAAYERLQRGQPVDVESLADQHPDYAEQLRELIPTIQAFIGLGADESIASSNAKSQAKPSERISQHDTPQQLGDFRVIRELGRGGMGTVFEAEQISMGRRVALKVLPFAALVQERSLQRFRNEVRAAAALDHTNIVSVYSIGEERGVHFYAMQLIRGQTVADMIGDLRKLCNPREAAINSEAPTIDSASEPVPASTKSIAVARTNTATDAKHVQEFFRKAAKLGIQAAEALQHAHDQGVLHRDIKPSNLLLDGEGQLYVTDFGLARIEADAGLTMTGDIVGTLRYMAPEQALAKRVVIDHRADVYSLGATLYELLTFQPAFGDTDRSELLKRIAFEEPMPLRKIDRRIPPELETIVLKAMAKNPEERYQTAQRLADDLRAFLEDRPIQAKRPSVLNRVGKWSRRHRGALVGTLAALIVISVGSIASTAMLLWERQRTEIAAAESKAITDFLVNDLLAAAEDENKLDREVTISEVLAKAEKKVDTAFIDQPIVEATLRFALTKTYNAIGKADLAERHGLRAMNLRRQYLGGLHIDTVRATCELGAALSRLRRSNQAVQLCLGQLHEVENAIGKDSLAAVESLKGVVSATWKQHTDSSDDFEKYEVKLKELCSDYYDRCQRVYGAEHEETLLARCYRAIWCIENNIEQLAEYQQTLELCERVLGVENKTTIYAASQIAYASDDEASTERLKNILEDYRRLYGIRNPRALGVGLNLARRYLYAKKYDDANRLADEGLAACRDMYGNNHWDTLSFMNLKATLLQTEGKKSEALTLRKEATTVGRLLFGTKDKSVLRQCLADSFLCVETGELDMARELADDGLKVCMEEYGPDDFLTLEYREQIAIILRAQTNFKDSEIIQRDVVQRAIKTFGPQAPETLGFRKDLGYVLWLNRKHAEALTCYDEVIVLAERLWPDSEFLKNCKHDRKVIADQFAQRHMQLMGEVYSLSGKGKEQREKINETLAALPEEDWAQRDVLAWILATSKLEEVRDPKAAMEQATKAAEISKHEKASPLDTLAAAHAANGDFDTAIELVQKAIELAPPIPRDRYKKHLASFRERKPWIMTVSK